VNEIDQNKKWPTWSLPKAMIPDYFFKLFLCFWLIPSLLGISFTMAGLLINYLLIDFIIYIGYKSRGQL
jgi:hypothetical protein